MNLVKLLLFPFAWIYGLITHIRNKLFDWKLIPSRTFNVPIISVGNLCVGGTGKTPHIEYLTRLLKPDYKIAILSRGYKRKSKGFIMVNKNHTQEEIGDEPMQYLKKFPDVTLAVDGNRVRGIQKILDEKPDVDVILMDDGFQHRYVKPGKSVILTDYHNIYTKDHLLPAGTLRESIKGAKRADFIVVTKSPKVLSPIIRRHLVKDIKPTPQQRLFYSFVNYDNPIPLKPGAEQDVPKSKFNYILMVTGVANSYPFQEYLRRCCNELIVLEFSDHHQYTQNDMVTITNEYNKLLTRNKAIFTTEKDATRLDREEFADYLEALPFYYVPIRIKFHDCDEIRYDKLILDYVKRSIKSS
jgi:tetraacyldisaccharide 4'-kinase